MSGWLLRRVVSSLLLVLVLASAVFFVVRLAPGDPLDRLASSDTITGADRELVRTRLGLDRPLLLQYVEWLGGMLRGDAGWSLAQQRPVADVVGEALGPTLLLTLPAYALHLLLAVAAALAMAARPGSAAARLVRTGGLVFYSLPTFWFALVLLLVFSRQLGWFPFGGLEAPDADFMPAGVRLLDLLHHLALPVLTLALGTFMGTARLLEASLDEILGQDFITAARARGVPEGVLLRRHALRNALLPLVTLAGLHLPALLGGAVAVETVFGWPGMGRVAVEALWARDYPVIMAVTVLAAAAVVTGSLLADVLYRRVDPRVRAGGEVRP
jgi:peptide/nickel transport system permease protein